MGMNLIGSAEFMLGAIFNLSVLLLAFFVVVGIFCGVWIGFLTLFDCGFCGARKWKSREDEKERKKRDKLELQQSSVTRPTLEEDEDYINYGGLELKRKHSVLTINFILLVAVVNIPIHYSQQTTAKKLRIYDGAGSQVVWNVSSTYGPSMQMGETYTDSFRIPWATDQMGFLEHWWEDARRRPLELLAVV